MQLKRFSSLILLVPLALSSCARSAASTKAGLPVGSLWSAPAVDGVINWQSASPMVLELREGYQSGVKASQTLSAESIESPEGNQEDDVQVAIRRMAEKDLDIAVVGATTNEATVRAASLVNFFNVPMIIPSAYGDNLLPSNNLWAFRLSAPGSAYANYFFNTLLPIAVPAPAEAEPDPNAEPQSRLKIAILYEQNTFGESAAVAAAHGAMRQSIDIGLYGNFSAAAPDPTRLKAQIDAMMAENVQLVYLVSGDPDVALTLVRAIRAAYPAGASPVLVGQAGGFATQAFRSSADAEGVFVLRQAVDQTNCPAELKSTAQAQMYAAVYLVDQAVNLVRENTPPAQPALTLPLPKASSTASDITALREKVRDTLKTMNLKVPCLGPVAFDNTGQNKVLQFEIIRIHDGQAVDSSAQELNDLLQTQTVPTETPAVSANG